MKDSSLKIISLVAIFILFSLGNLSTAAEPTKADKKNSVLSFFENSRHKKNVITIGTATRSRPIIDINSQLTININKDMVFQEAAEHFDTGISEKTRKSISEIREILKHEDKLFDLIRINLEDDKNKRDKKRRKFVTDVGKILDFIFETKIEKTKKDALEAWNGRDDNIDGYKKVMSIVRRDIDLYFDRLKKSLGESTVVFRLGGWIIHKGKETPIHIEGFDRYEKFEYQQYPFFTKPTNEEVVAGIRAMKESAIEINNGQRSIIIDINVNFKKIFQELKGKLDGILKCLKDSFEQILKEQSIEDLKAEIPEISDLLDNTTELLDTYNDLKKELDTINDEVNKLKDSPGELENHFLLISSVENLVQRNLQDDLKNFKVRIGNINEKLKSILEDQKLKDILKGKVKEKLEEIRDKIKEMNCFEEIKKIIDENFRFFKELWEKIKSIRDSLKPVKEQYDLKLGDKVDSILLDNIPPNGVVDLKFSGPRDEGDEIAFVAALEQRSEDGKEVIKSVTIARQYMMMFKLLKLEMNLGLIFANPLTKEKYFEDKGITITKNFQAAPSYSILFKPAFRKSIFYNKYIRFGIGINVSALDFNQDSIYELGLGLVLSAFNDWVQAGVGMNMELDRVWYWFFGLNIPFAEIPLPTVITGMTSK